MVLSKREKLMVAALAGFCVVLAVYFLVALVRGHEKDLIRDISRTEILLKKAQAISENLGSMTPTAKNGNSLTRSLIGTVEELASKNGLKTKVQLNRVPIDKSKGVEGIDVKLDDLTLDEMLRFVFDLENSLPPLAIDQLEIAESFRSKQKLRLTIRVLGQI